MSSAQQIYDLAVPIAAPLVLLADAASEVAENRKPKPPDRFAGNRNRLALCWRSRLALSPRMLHKRNSRRGPREPVGVQSYGHSVPTDS